MKPLALLITIALATTLAPATAADARPSNAPPVTCVDSFLPVSLAPGQPATQQIFTRLCRPPGRTPDTVQLLVHGCLYNSLYWDFPDPTDATDRYSYVAHATEAGYATLAVDMLGNGRSSHPLSGQVTVDAGVWVLHQVVLALRAAGFAKVVEVSWSFGTFFSWLEVSRYHDVDAAVFTGATHHLAVSPALLKDALSLEPAGPDPGYLTTQPGTRQRIFYDPAPADPAVVAYDEAHKDLMTDAEILGFPGALAEPLDIRVPVLLVLSATDPLFCGAAATDCTSAGAMLAQERPFLGPDVTAYLQTNSGHALDLGLHATDAFAVELAWLAGTT
jgi:pimeloyl-ACP methyl ester carboxylesterase